MIYLSQLTLNPSSNRVQSELRNPYEMHRTLARAFGDTEEEQQSARCLFRVESDAPANVAIVLVQSKIKPSWDQVAAHAGDRYFAAEPKEKRVAVRFSAGQNLGFRLRANPTTAHRGNRTGLYDDESRMSWFTRKAELAGFAPVMVRVTDEPAVTARRGVSAKDAVFSAARFDGLLQVTDPQKLAEAMENGIGAAKGFGFGLLSLAPPSSVR